MVWGLQTSCKERGIDRRHFAAFLAFIAAVIAATGTTLVAAVLSLYGHARPDPAWEGFNFIVGAIVFASLLVTFFAGLFSRGIRRIALIASTFMVLLMNLGIAASHFGD